MDCYTDNKRKISRPVILLFSSEIFASIWCRQPAVWHLWQLGLKTDPQYMINSFYKTRSTHTRWDKVRLTNYRCFIQGENEHSWIFTN
jgi:hypothetical protein